MDNHPGGEVPNDHTGLPLNQETPYHPQAPPGSQSSYSSFEPGAVYSTPSSVPASSQYGRAPGHQSSSSHGSGGFSGPPQSSSSTSGYGSMPDHFPPPPTGQPATQPSDYAGYYSSSSEQGSSQAGMYGAAGQQPQPGHHPTGSTGSSMFGRDGQGYNQGHQQTPSNASPSTMYGYDGQQYNPGHRQTASGASTSTMYGRDGQNNRSSAYSGAGSDSTSQFARHGQYGQGNEEAGGQQGNETFYEEDSNGEHADYGGPGAEEEPNYEGYYDDGDE